ncbi:MAG: hypothetical protein MPJ53_02130 [Alphaproteobacteria bacterium]|nr:hypothetical protein [Alphaproteobacteria bacterium]MDA7989653.1 hypothetical protein [Gammaproteobacteria bacterium]
MTDKITLQLQSDWPVHMSYDKDDREIVDFYSSINGAISQRGSIFYQKRQIDIFLLAMAIGQQKRLRTKIKSRSESIRRDALLEREVWLMCSVALAEEKDLAVLGSPEEVVRICEEYANGGIHTLISMHRMPGVLEPFEESLDELLEKKAS